MRGREEEEDEEEEEFGGGPYITLHTSRANEKFGRDREPAMCGKEGVHPSIQTGRWLNERYLGE